MTTPIRCVLPAPFPFVRLVRLCAMRGALQAGATHLCSSLHEAAPAIPKARCAPARSAQSTLYVIGRLPAAVWLFASKNRNSHSFGLNQMVDLAERMAGSTEAGLKVRLRSRWIARQEPTVWVDVSDDIITLSSCASVLHGLTKHAAAGFRQVQRWYLGTKWRTGFWRRRERSRQLGNRP